MCYVPLRKVLYYSEYLNFVRTLPTTWGLLKRYGAVLYEGHNRIDLGSYPNIMALLTGEVTEVGFVFQNLDGGRLWVDEQESELISKVYREQGYVTFHMEDAAGMATFQVQGKVGFKNPPADFYYRDSMKVSPQCWARFQILTT